MKEKIYTYLMHENRSVSTREIIQKFFHVLDQYPSQIEHVVTSLLKDDPRFVRDEIGQWSVRKQPISHNLADTIFTIVARENLMINQKTAIPIVLGIARSQNYRLISHHYLLLEIPHNCSDHLRGVIERRQAEFSASVTPTQYYQLIDGTVVVEHAPAQLLAMVNEYFRSQLGLEIEPETLSLVTLARKLIAKAKIKSITDIANALNLAYYEPLDIVNRIKLIHEILCLLLDRAMQLGIYTITDLTSLLNATKRWVDFSRYHFNQDYIKNMPQTPGVYFMKDRHEQIFYVGKAKNLKSRIESYFVNRSEMDTKTTQILLKLYDLSFEQVGSELEALLLENHYIQLYQPQLNTQLNIHPIDVSKYQRRRIILFLPNSDKNQALLLMVNGTTAARKVVINLAANFDWKILTHKINQIFFESTLPDSDFSVEQVEIIWRWFSTHQEYINFLDIDRHGSPEQCCEMVKRYCEDDKVLTEKYFYL